MRKRTAIIGFVACVFSLIMACSIGVSPSSTPEARDAANLQVPTPPPIWQTFGTQGSDNYQFSSPYGVAVDRIGRIYVGDQ